MVHQIWENHPEIQRGLEQVKRIMLTEMRVVHLAVREKIVEYMEAPGKYLRSGLCLLFAQAVDGQIKPEKLYFAAYVEVLHLATLIHDDVIDEADIRRGIVVAHRQFSNRIAIYAGDYLMAYAGRLLAKGIRLMQLEKDELGSFNERLLEGILAGELAQLMNQFDTSMTMKRYLKQIQGKTAFLFGLACQLGSLQNGTPLKQTSPAFRAGRSFGMAFQLRDDMIDYQLTAQESGKPARQDIQNGIYTAPLLFAIEEDKSIRQDLVFLIESKEEALVSQIIDKINRTKAKEQTRALMQAYLYKMEQQLALLETGNRSVDWKWLLEAMLDSYA
ncbi:MULTISPECIES: polyprenyl synthetase family protein [unclassified Streptococcus]|uniref:polyprenyl synthetase family protein n=1 Tax=unclassified Streptococcus TaxID=2608887 RepID=UPI001071C55E|nr:MULTISPECIES: polyprenyl synthetase family protein [unclassified Streptococcus]MBF0787589.1 polyprenyl synthetase family protein [Streptococcus sp. 19428wC2_LYSM12]MCQ9211976.1 polyprenyl synthetase family protein [Streptococcus sp. B01]MCQ9213305.1 polyprenyl synthetase family protein [Streptococcus sp. O1]TFV05432.1 polyprenyl synthetase family protein [Streptococcus sp. LYSM12]